MNLLRLLLLVTIIAAGQLQAAEHLKPVVLKDNQSIIQVKGVVCSFCAYGTEKNLSKLDFLDQSYFDGDGVMLDIHTHRITLALNNKKLVDYAAINNAIVKGGYDPVTYYVRVHGRVSEQDGKYTLKCLNNGQVYHLQGQDLAALTLKKDVFVEGQITVESIKNLAVSSPVSLLVGKNLGGN